MDRAAAHATLGVSAEATPEQIRAAYRRRAFETHPDRSAGSTAAFQAVAEAYRVLSDSSGAPEQGGSPTPDGRSRVPPTDAAQVLFEYLSDLASDMILNGATPDAVVAFLAGEGCPETVARALERDLRTRVQGAGSEGAREPAPSDTAGRSPETARANGSPDPREPPSSDTTGQPPETSSANGPPDPAAAPAQRRPRMRSAAKWAGLGLAGAAVTACAFIAWRSVATGKASEPPRESVPSAAVAAAPSPPDRVGPAPARSSPGPAPARSSPARLRSPAEGPRQRPPTRDDKASLQAVSARLDAERDALDADRARLAAEAAELQAERQRIDAAQAELGSDPALLPALRQRQSAYNARLEAARRTERALQQRTADLNARIAAYNKRLVAERQR